MGLGGVTIAALHAVMCLEVPFSDGLGGVKSCKKNNRKFVDFIVIL